MSWKNEYFLKKKSKREMATGGRVRCEYFYDTNDEYVSGVWAQSIACSVLSSQQFGERYLEELCNQKSQRKTFLCQNYWVQYCQHTKDCFKEILGLQYLLCIFFTNNVINNNFHNIFMYKFLNRIKFLFSKMNTFSVNCCVVIFLLQLITLSIMNYNSQLALLVHFF